MKMEWREKNSETFLKFVTSYLMRYYRTYCKLKYLMEYTHFKIKRDIQIAA